jgi:hypothetical protein
MIAVGEATLVWRRAIEPDPKFVDHSVGVEALVRRTIPNEGRPAMTIGATENESAFDPVWLALVGGDEPA